MADPLGLLRDLAIHALAGILLAGLLMGRKRR